MATTTKKTRLLKLFDRLAFWSVVTWAILALLVFWLFRLNSELHHNVRETQRATKANTDAIAFLCDTNAIIEALASQTVSLLKSQPNTSERAITIQVFEGYIEILKDRAPCVKAEKAALS